MLAGRALKWNDIAIVLWKDAAFVWPFDVLLTTMFSDFITVSLPNGLTQFIWQGMG